MFFHNNLVDKVVFYFYNISKKVIGLGIVLSYVLVVPHGNKLLLVVLSFFSFCFAYYQYLFIHIVCTNFYSIVRRQAFKQLVCVRTIKAT